MAPKGSRDGRRRRVASLVAMVLATAVVAFPADGAPAAPVAAAISSSCPDGAQPGPGTCRITFNFTGGLQSFTVPDGVTSVDAWVYGAYGGPMCDVTKFASTFGVGGGGGAIQGSLPVTAGEKLTVLVGGSGSAGPGSDCSVFTAVPGRYRASRSGAGGFGGGGGAGTPSGATGTGAGGGGASLLISPGSRAQLVAGGGGGSGSGARSVGGNGSIGPAPSPGCAACASPTGGSGGPATTSSAGAGGTAGTSTACPSGGPGTAGRPGTGPPTGSGTTGGRGASWGQGASKDCDTFGTFTGGGGGGGYFGGGGGDWGGCGAGSGGSSYAAPDVTLGPGIPIDPLRGAISGLTLFATEGNGQVVLVTHGGQQLQGTITDQNGKVLALVRVRVDGSDDAGNRVRTQAFTDIDGNYKVTLGPGTYTVSPEQPAPSTPKTYFAPDDCSQTVVYRPLACRVVLKAGEDATASFKLTSLVVNSTQSGLDEAQASEGICDVTPTAPRQACTLPQAVAVVDKIGGGTVPFDIPDALGNRFVKGVPRIDEPGNTLSLDPEVTIDGTTQPGSHRVELYGPSDPNTVGLWAQLGRTTVRGMIIGGYSVALELGSFRNGLADHEAPGRQEPIEQPDDIPASPQADDTVQSDTLQSSGALEFYWYPSGEPATEKAGLLVLSGGGGQIGGHGPGQGNIFDAPLLQQDVTGSVVQGNTFTSDAGAGNFGNALALEDGGGNTVGGAQPGAGNTVDNGGMLILESHDVVQGNTMVGLDIAGSSNTVGGATSTPGEAPGNRVVSACNTEPDLCGDEAGITIVPSVPSEGNVVQGNDITGFDRGIVLGSGAPARLSVAPMNATAI